MVLKKISDWLEDVWSLSGEVEAAERRERKILFSVCAACFFSALVVAPATAANPEAILIVALIGTAFVEAFIMVWMACGRRLSHRQIAVALMWMGFCIFLMDLHARVYQETNWPLFILVVDLLLVLRLSQHYAVGFVCGAVVYLIIVTAESAFRFGLFDVPGLGTYERRREVFAEMSDCAKPPCKREIMQECSGMIAGLLVFVGDFIATRGFATQVLEEQASMRRTVAAVQHITTLLAGYDIDAVSRVLSESEDDLPEKMHLALRRMEANLRQYRPYLPTALFEEDEVALDAFTTPPGEVSGEATIVFTDIRSSTAIWESAPEGMRSAMRVHNSVIRSLIKALSGYEVKTIGDAFMVAFEAPHDGAIFALQVQQLLYEADWPTQLLEESPLCARGLLWAGLTVRIGVNSGPVSVERSPLTARMDYFGHTVNVAARLEGLCLPGSVAIRSELWSAVCDRCSAVVMGPQAMPLKGVSAQTFVTYMWPPALAGRRHNPLRETSASLGTDSPSVSLTSTSSMSHPKLRGAPSSNIATVGVVEVDIDSEENANAALRKMNAGLSMLTVGLDQSGGRLVSLLGSCVCVGWNLGHTTPSHVENAIRFAQKLAVQSSALGAGFVTGPVQHGDVGARQQRFVAVMGPTVRRSVVLCSKAISADATSLYEPPAHMHIPSALEHILTPSSEPGVYNVVPFEISDIDVIN